ncbi:MAG: hypothetical protein ACOCXQ_02610 [Patescibacteria group bacterium]
MSMVSISVFVIGMILTALLTAFLTWNAKKLFTAKQYIPLEYYGNVPEDLRGTAHATKCLSKVEFGRLVQGRQLVYIDDDGHMAIVVYENVGSIAYETAFVCFLETIRLQAGLTSKHNRMTHTNVPRTRLFSLVRIENSQLLLEK